MAKIGTAHYNFKVSTAICSSWSEPLCRAAQNTEYKKLKEAEVKDENSKRKADERREDDEEAVDEEEEEDITLELVQEMLRYLLSESGMVDHFLGFELTCPKGTTYESLLLMKSWKLWTQCYSLRRT